jgi:hypothetical protein
MVATPAHAGKVELTTYYPAPYGEYQQLQATGSDANNNTPAFQARGNAGTGLVATNANRVGIGIMTPQAVLDISSTTSGFLPPRMTSGERAAIGTVQGNPSLADGMVIYNTTANQLQVWNGSNWMPVVGGSSPRLYTGTSNANITNSSWTDIITLTNDYPGGDVFMFFEGCYRIESAAANAPFLHFQLLVDGTQRDLCFLTTGRAISGGEEPEFVATLSHVQNLSAGSHTIRVQAHHNPANTIGNNGDGVVKGTPRLTVMY